MTYSLESTIAEKFDAILQRFELTGRMKDFYDIYYLAKTFNFDGAKLQTAIFETLQWRGTPYERDSFKLITHHLLPKKCFIVSFRSSLKSSRLSSVIALLFISNASFQLIGNFLAKQLKEDCCGNYFYIGYYNTIVFS